MFESWLGWTAEASHGAWDSNNDAIWSSLCDYLNMVAINRQWALI